MKAIFFVSGDDDVEQIELGEVEQGIKEGLLYLLA